MAPELADFQAEYAALCRHVGASGELLFSRSDDGSPHIEYIGGEYHNVVTQRGSEWERRTTADKKEALYWCVSDLVWSMASEYELKTRKPGFYTRRVIFDKGIELMAQINPEWATRKAEEIRIILARSPYSMDEQIANEHAGRRP
ncbi:MAG: hypothetical protein H7Y38_13320 [Armatimonadetes bacterium]|nr:hypothetical protein [Armatimonadota bacterium]